MLCEQMEQGATSFAEFSRRVRGCLTLLIDALHGSVQQDAAAATWLSLESRSYSISSLLCRSWLMLMAAF